MLQQTKSVYNLSVSMNSLINLNRLTYERNNGDLNNQTDLNLTGEDDEQKSFIQNKNPKFWDDISNEMSEKASLNLSESHNDDTKIELKELSAETVEKKSTEINQKNYLNLSINQSTTNKIQSRSNSRQIHSANFDGINNTSKPTANSKIYLTLKKKTVKKTKFKDKCLNYFDKLCCSCEILPFYTKLQVPFVLFV
jgi:hypothetical protein